MPEIPIAGFVLEALGAVCLAVILSSFQRQRPRAGVRDWSVGLWLLAAALLTSIVQSRLSDSPRRIPVLAVAVVLAYWSPALLLLGTYCRATDRERPGLRRRLLIGLAAVGLLTTLVAPLAGEAAHLVRSGTRTFATMLGDAVGGVVLLRSDVVRRVFGARVLAGAFLGHAAEEALFFGVSVARLRGGLSAMFSADVLVEVEMVLLMLTGVGMVAWLLEEERVSGLRLQEALHRREALSAMGTLLGGVAHEVRNPLFAITATLDAFGARWRGDASASPHLAAMREQVQRLSRLMTELLEYGRPISAEMKRCSVGVLAAEAVASCSDLSRQAAVSVEIAGAPATADVLVDESRLLQVLENLIRNAIEHTPRDGRVRVEVRPEARSGRAGVRCDVRDDGPGFTATDLPRLFEPFFSRRQGGTGLGLSIVQRNVEQHSGQVGAANHPEGGGVVSVWLPVEPELPRAPSASSAGESKAKGAVTA